MTITDIRNRIVELKKNSQFRGSNNALKEQIILTYSDKVLQDIDSILGKDDFSNGSSNRILISRLSNYLKENWALTKASLLSYTALADHPITHLLCDIAQLVAVKKNLPVIKALMPTVSYDSLLPGYYPNLDEIDIYSVIKTHSIQCGCRSVNDFLVPVAIYTHIDINEFNQPVYNPYYDVFSHDHLELYFNDNVLLLISEHSQETKSIYEAAKDYRMLLNNSDSLLNQINQLIKQLQYNSSHGGIGQDDSSGKGAYVAIVKFIEYWTILSLSLPKKLNLEQQKKLALLKPLIERIESIQYFASTKDSYMQIDNCIGLYQEQLKVKIRGQEALLATLNFDQQTKKNQIESVINSFNLNVFSLKKALENLKIYLGYDRYGISANIIIILEIDLFFENYQAVSEAFKGRTSEEVKAIGKLPGVSQKIIRAIDNLENFILFIMTKLNEEILPTFLEVIRAEIGAIIKNVNDFSCLLILLTPNQCKIICRSLKNLFIKTAYDFNNVLQCISVEHRTTIFNQMENQLLPLIKTSFDFKMILIFLTPAQCFMFCNKYRNYLEPIVENTDNFRAILQYLIPEQCFALCKGLKYKLKDLYDFNNIVRGLTGDQFSAVCHQLSEELKYLIKTIKSFVTIFFFLRLDQRTIFYNLMQNHLHPLIKTAGDFISILQYLEPKQRNTYFYQMQNQLLSLVKTTDELVTILTYLTPKQRTTVCGRIRDDKLKALVKAPDNLITIVKYLKPGQCATVCTSLAEAEIISLSNLKNILRNLSLEQCSAVCGVLKNNLKSLIKTANHFETILFFLSEGQRTILYYTMQNQLIFFIKTTDDLISIIQYLTPEQCLAVCSALKDELKSLIKTVNDFGRVLNQLETDKIQSVIVTLVSSFDFLKVVKTVLTMIKIQLNLERDTSKSYHELLTLQTIMNSTQISDLNFDKKSTICIIKLFCLVYEEIIRIKFSKHWFSSDFFSFFKSKNLQKPACFALLKWIKSAYTEINKATIFKEHIKVGDKSHHLLLHKIVIVALKNPEVFTKLEEDFNQSGMDFSLLLF